MSGLMILGYIFLILKLCHVIDWSWIFIITPFLIKFLMAVLTLIHSCLPKDD